MIDFLCYHPFTTIWPLRWHNTRAGLWIIERAGKYAYPMAGDGNG